MRTLVLQLYDSMSSCLAFASVVVLQVLDSQKLKTIWDDPTSSIKDIPLSTQGVLQL